MEMLCMAMFLNAQSIDVNLSLWLNGCGSRVTMCQVPNRTACKSSINFIGASGQFVMYHHSTSTALSRYHCCLRPTAYEPIYGGTWVAISKWLVICVKQEWSIGLLLVPNDPRRSSKADVHKFPCQANHSSIHPSDSLLWQQTCQLAVAS